MFTGITGGKRENISRGIGAGQESLELYAFHTSRIVGERPSCYRVHAVSGRRPWQLHGSGRVRRISETHGQEIGGRDEIMDASGVDDRLHVYRRPGVMRRRVRKRSDEGNNRKPRNVRFRYGHHPVDRPRMRIVLGHQVEIADDLFDFVDDDNIRRKFRFRTRTESGDNLPCVRRPCRSKDIRSTVIQYRPVGVQRGGFRPRKLDKDVHRSKTVRFYGKSAASTVFDIRQ